MSRANDVYPDQVPIPMVPHWAFDENEPGGSFGEGCLFWNDASKFGRECFGAQFDTSEMGTIQEFVI